MAHIKCYNRISKFRVKKKKKKPQQIIKQNKKKMYFYSCYTPIQYN